MDAERNERMGFVLKKWDRQDNLLLTCGWRHQYKGGIWPSIGRQYRGYLDEQFYQLEELQDEASPNFVEEVVTLFFRDSSRLVANIEKAFEKCPQDFRTLDSFMHQLKDSTSRHISHGRRSEAFEKKKKKKKGRSHFLHSRRKEDQKIEEENSD